MASIHARVAEGRERLRLAGLATDEADLDARLLAEHVLGWDAARFFAYGHEPEPPAFRDAYFALIGRRMDREPVAYITGRQEFWDLAFEVTPAVLIPRPETELIVETALAEFPDPDAPLAVADVCTGSGCLAVALAHERLRARVVAVDISEPALAVARRNAERHGVADRIDFRHGDLLQPAEGPFDLIVSNPPYVPEGDRARLPAEVRDREPAVALFAGADGLDVIRRLVRDAAVRLTPGGRLIVEIGYGQARAAGELISSVRGLTMIGIRKDLQGIPRTALARRD
ncbi:MAG: peptide chain release factor N(5)-glutamine methyltransferase [Betaproteobacteria bacterium]